MKRICSLCSKLGLPITLLLISGTAHAATGFGISPVFTLGMRAPAAPPGLTASMGVFVDKVQLAWSAVSNAAGYQVWRHTVNASNRATQIANCVTPNYNDHSAVGGHYYYCWVKATNFAGASACSTSAGGWKRSAGLTYYSDADMDGDGKMDLVLYDRAKGIWYVQLSASGYGLASAILGGPDCTLVPGDYDGDRKTDPAVYRPADGMWGVMLSSSGYGVATTAPGFGGYDYTPVQRDYDGDGKTDPAVYGQDNGDWYVMLSGSDYGIAAAHDFGGVGTAPVPGDYDGDGKSDPALYQEATGDWYVMLSGSGYGLA